MAKTIDPMEERREKVERRILFDVLTHKISRMLVRKNENYGGGIFEPNPLVPDVPPAKLILARMSDKIQRLFALAGGEPDKVGEAFDDTMRDLAGYVILWLYNDLKTNCYSDVRTYAATDTYAETALRDCLENVIEIYYGRGALLDSERDDALGKIDDLKIEEVVRSLSGWTEPTPKKAKGRKS